MSRIIDLIKNGSDIGIIESNLNGVNIDLEIDLTGDTPLMVAVRIGRKDIVELLISKGANKNKSKTNGVTALLIASQNGYKDIAELVCTSESINKVTEDGDRRSPLIIAAINGHDETLKLLLMNHSDVQYTDNHSWTALMYAIKFGHLNCVKTLVKNGADINYLYEVKGQEENILSPLLVAMESPNIESPNMDIINYLLEKDPVLDRNCGLGNTELMIAALRGNDAIVAALLSRGASINKKNDNHKTPLMLAVEGNHKSTVELLLQRGASINEEIVDDWSPLIVTAEKGYLDMAQFLLEKGAALNKILPDGFSALLIAAKNGHTELVKLFLDSGDSLEYLSLKGIKALFRSDSKINKEIICLLLTRGKCNKSIFDLLNKEYIKRLSPDEKKLELTKVIDGANLANNQNKDQIDLLIKMGALDGVNDENFSELSQSIKNYYLVQEALKENSDQDKMKKYMQKGANINLRMYNSSEETLLHHMVTTPRLDLLEFFLEQKNHVAYVANVDVPDEKGDTCLHLAAERGDHEAINLLLRYNPTINKKNEDSKEPAEMTQNETVKSTLRDFQSKKEMAARDADVTELYEIFNEDKCYDERMRIFNAIKNEDSIRKNIDTRRWLDDNNIRNILRSKFRLTEHGQRTDLYITSDEDIGNYNLLKVKVEEFKRNPNLQQKLSLGVCFGNHWVSLIIIKDPDNSKGVFVLYHDPFGDQIPSEIMEKVLNVYTNVKILSSNQQMQPPGDGHSCGLHTLVNLAYYSTLTNDQLKAMITQNLRVQELVSETQIPQEEKSGDAITSLSATNLDNNKPVMSIENLLVLLSNPGQPDRITKLNEALGNHYFNFNSKDSMGNTILHHAVLNNWTDLLVELIKKGANPNCRNADGDTPLHKAVHVTLAKNAVDTTIIKMLVEHGSDISITDNAGKTPFSYLTDTIRETVKTQFEKYIIEYSKTGDYNKVEELFKLGVNLNYQDEETKASSLYYAIKFGHTKLREFLISNKGELFEPQASNEPNSNGEPGNSALGMSNIKGESKQQEDNKQVIESNNQNLYQLIKRSAAIDFAEHKNFAVARRLANDDIDIVGQNGVNLLHIAARQGNVDQINSLLSGNINFRVIDEDRKNILHYAVQTRNTEVLKSIIDNEKINSSALLSMLNEKDINGMRALDYAVQNGDVDSAKTLMEKQIYLYAKKNPITGYNPLLIHYAVGNPNVSVEDIESLVSTCASLLMIYDNSEIFDDKEKLKELRKRLLNGDLEVHESRNIEDIKEIDSLIKNYSTDDAMMAEKRKTLIQKIVNYQDRDFRITPLHFAVKGKNINLINYFVEIHANFNLEDIYRLTPLHYAVWANYTNVVRALVSCRGMVDVNKDDLLNGRTSVHYAAINNNEIILDLLLRNNPNLNIRDKDGCLPLHYAVTNMCEKSMIEKLIIRTNLQGSEIININIEDNAGKTPLEYAVIMGRTDIVARFLEERGVFEHINFDKEKTNILHLAAARGYLNIIKGIEPGRDDGGVILNTLDEYGRTPLHLASMNGQKDVVEHLIGKDVKIDAADKDKRTALHLAIINGKVNVLKILIDAGLRVEKKDIFGLSAVSYVFMSNNEKLKQEFIDSVSEKYKDINKILVNELSGLGEQKN